MIHLVLLVGIGFLIARIIWNIFNLFQSLFQRKPKSLDSSEIKIQQPISYPSKKKSPPSNDSREQKCSVPPIKLEEPPKSKISASKIEQDEKIQNVVVQPQPQRLVEPQEGYLLKLQEGNQRRDSGGFAKLERKNYEEKISRLNEQNARHRRQKQIYVKRIQEIIQHVTNETDFQESRNSTEDEDWQVINNLKLQITAANRKIQDQREQFKERLATQSRQHNEKINNYVQSIEEMRQMVIQLQDENKQLILQSQASEEDEPFAVGNTINQLKTQKQNLFRQNSEKQIIVKSLQQEHNKLKNQLEAVKESLLLKQNDLVEAQTKLSAKIKSLQTQKQNLMKELQEERSNKFRLEREVEEAYHRQSHEKIQTQVHQNQATKNSDLITSLEQTIRSESLLRQELQQKYIDTQEELKFCQEQIQNAKETENQLRDKLKKAEAQKARSISKKEEMEMHPDYLALKRKYEQLESRSKGLSPASDNASKGASNMAKSQRQKRELSPTFPNIPNKANIATSPQSEFLPQRAGNDYEIKFKNNSTLIPQPMVSTVYTGTSRHKTPSERPVVSSMVGLDPSQNHFGETNIIDEAQRQLVINQLSTMKKIKIKKTRLMFSLAQKVNKPISEYLLNAPNIIFLLQLANKNIVGAFSQTAFSKDNKFSRSSVVNKGMFFDIVSEIFITNEGREDLEVIRYEENILIWGNRQFVINCNEPISLTVDLKSQNGAYPTASTTQEFLRSESNTVPITKIQVHRILFG